MKVIDPIADMLTRIRNANFAGKTEVSMPSSTGGRSERLRARSRRSSLSIVKRRSGHLKSASTFFHIFLAA